MTRLEGLLRRHEKLHPGGVRALTGLDKPTPGDCIGAPVS